MHLWTGRSTTQKRADEWTPGNTSSSIERAVKLVLLEEAQQQFEEHQVSS